MAQGAGTVDPSDGWTFSLRGDPNHRNRLILDMTKGIPGQQGYEWWSIDMLDSTDNPIGTGSYIGNRFAYEKPGVVGFSWIGNHRGNNSLTAIVEILDIQYPESGDVPTSLAMDFTQFEETWGDLSPSLETNKWAKGSLRINSGIAPSAVPEPSTFGLLIMVVYLVSIAYIVRRKNRRR